MDPRLHPPQARKDPLSPLMRAIADNRNGGKVNRCPFGCTDQQLDDHNFCIHLVGFTNDKEYYEPMVRRKGRRVVEVRRDKIDTGMVDEDGPVFEEGEPQLLKCQEGDEFDQITTSYRVYRKVPKIEPKARPVEEPKPQPIGAKK